MIILQSDKLGVYMHADRDWQGIIHYRVVYGLDAVGSQTTVDFKTALAWFNEKAIHSAKCERMINYD